MELEALPAELLGDVVAFLQRPIPFIGASPTVLLGVSQSTAPWQQDGVLDCFPWRPCDPTHASLLAARNAFLDQAMVLDPDAEWRLRVSVHSEATGDDIKLLCAIAPNATDLSLAYCTEADDSVIEVAAASLRRVQVLDLSCCGWVTERTLEPLRNSKTLTSLRLQGCTAVDDVTMEVVATMSSLQKLNIEEAKVTDAGINLLVGLRLQELEMFNCEAVTERCAEHIARMSSLTSLGVPNGAAVDSAVKHFTALRHLAELRFTSSPISDAVLTDLWRNLPALTELWLWSKNSMSDACLNALWSLPLLQTVDLSWSTGPGDGAFIDIRNASRLTALELTRIETVNDRALERISAARQLRLLKLECESVTDIGLKHLGQLPLTNLELSNATGSVSATAFCAAVSSIKTLTTLRLYHAPFVNVDCVRAIAALPRLSDLTLFHDFALRDEHFEALRGAKRLTSIRVGSEDESATDVAFAHLAELRWLTNIDVETLSAISAEGLRSLVSLPDLETLIVPKVADLSGEEIDALLVNHGTLCYCMMGGNVVLDSS